MAHGRPTCDVNHGAALLALATPVAAGPSARPPEPSSMPSSMP
jgi:hypothetical protein